MIFGVICVEVSRKFSKNPHFWQKSSSTNFENFRKFIYRDGVTPPPKKNRSDIYTSSIGGPETETKCKVVFIDDTLIIHCVQSNEEGTKEAQQHLNMIYKQSEELNLRLNGSKFQIMRIHDNNIVPPETKIKDP